jgi:predicted RNA-binding protein with TRAM domain
MVFERRIRRPLLPKPVKVGEECEVAIEEVSRRGDGVAKIQNFVIFVPGTKVGDKVRVRITRVASRFAVAEKVSTMKITLTHSPSIKEGVGEVTEKTEPATPAHPIELTSIEGIGVKRAEKLNSCGVNSVQDLADFNSKELSQKLQISEKRVSKWIDKAKDAFKTEHS